MGVTGGFARDRAQAEALAGVETGAFQLAVVEHHHLALNVFQEQLAIVGALKLKLLPQEKKAVEQRGTSSVEAYSLYLLARRYWITGNFGDVRREERVMRICSRAVQLDPYYGQAWALLALSLPEPDTHWLEGFARGFHALADRAGLTLVGGDTVRGPRVVTVQVLGFVPAGLALRRDGARPGDVLYASGSLGDAAAGLKLLRDGRRADTDSSLVRRYRFAEPRLALGMALRGVASAAIDVSDGLLGDLGKLCDASGVGAILELEQLPLSRALLASFDATQAERFALGGGDDYELAFAVPRAAVSEMETSLATIGRITRIGEIVTGHGVRCQRAGQTVEPEIAGYDHFG